MRQWTRREMLWAATAVGMARQASAASFEVLSERPLQLQTLLSDLDGLLTPTELFFVRSHFGMPRRKPSGELSLSGRVEKPLRLTLAELKRLPSSSVTAVLQCAGNGRALFQPPTPGLQWTHGAMGQAEWHGVRLAHLLEKASVKAKARHLHLIGADLPLMPQTPRFIRSLPMEKAMQDDTLVAWQMNGAPLTLEHGAPLRLVVPGWTGSYWTKWLTGLVASEEEAAGFFMQKAYRMSAQSKPLSVMPVKSVVTFPEENAQLPVGKMEVRGLAFSGAAAVREVEVSFDSGQTWQQASLEGAPGVGRWQRFVFPFDADAGAKSVWVRATDAHGATQPREALWNPSGYHWNAWHRVNWTVR